MYTPQQILDAVTRSRIEIEASLEAAIANKDLNTAALCSGGMAALDLFAHRLYDTIENPHFTVEEFQAGFGLTVNDVDNEMAMRIVDAMFPTIRRKGSEN